MTDGEITLTVNLTAGDIQQTASKLRSQIQGIFQANAGKQLSASAQNALVQLDKLNTKSEQLQNTINALNNAELDKIRQEYADANNELIRQEELLERLKANKNVSSQGFAIGLDPEKYTKSTQGEIEQTQQRIEQLRSTLSNLDKDYDKIAQHGADYLPDFQKATQNLNQTNNQIVVATGKFEQLKQASGSAGSEIASNLQGAKKNLQIVASVIGAVGAKVNSVVNSIKGALKNVEKSISKAFSGKTLKRNLTTLLKYTLGVRSLYFAFRKLRSAVKEGLQNLVQWESSNNATNQAMTQLQTSLLYLKNAWAAAFAPIVNFVMPYLTALIDRLAAVGNYIARFVAALTGQATVIQAVKVNAGDYAKSLDKAGKSAGGAAKKQKQLNDRLAQFDDLNVLGKDKDNAGSGGGGGGAGGLDTPKIEDMFKRISTSAMGIVDKLKEAWKTSDFTEIGSLFGKKIEDALYSIPWGKIQSTANSIGKSIGTFLNGLFGDGSTFKAAGHTLADALNTVTTAFKGFFDTYQKGGLGKGVAEFLRAIFTDTDWKTLGSNIGEGFKTVMDEATALLSNFPSEEIFAAITQLLQGVDWQGVFISAINLLQGAIVFTAEFATALFTALSKAMEDTDPHEVAQAMVNVFNSIKVEDIANALGALISAAITQIFTNAQFSSELTLSIVAFLLQGFIDASEDSEFESVGEQLIDGLLTGIGGAMVGISNWIADNVITPLVDGFCDLLGIHSPSTVAIEWGKDIIQGLLNGITEMIGSVRTKWDEIKTAISDKITATKLMISEKWTAIKSDLMAKWNDIKSGASTAFIGIRDTIVNIWTSLKSKIKDIINGIIGIINGMINGVASGINSMVRLLNAFKVEIPSGVPLLGGKSIGFNLSTISAPKIPYLAQGAVIPPNKEFMAVLGDQKQGTNIEAPLDTIKQAVSEEMAAYINVMQEGFDEVVAAINRKELVVGDKEIGRANSRYLAQQKLIRGTSI